MERSDNKTESAWLTVRPAVSLGQGGEEGEGGASFPSTATGCRGMASDPSGLGWPPASSKHPRFLTFRIATEQRVSGKKSYKFASPTIPLPFAYHVRANGGGEGG